MNSLLQALHLLRCDLLSLPIGDAQTRSAELTALLRFGADLNIIKRRVVIEVKLCGSLLLNRVESVLRNIYGITPKLIRSTPRNDIGESCFLLRIDDPSLARKLGLIDTSLAPVRGLPNHLALASGSALKGLVRGAILASGVFTESTRKFAMEVYAPSNETALCLQGSINKLNAIAKIKEVRGSYKVVIRDIDNVAPLLRNVGARNSVEKIEQFIKLRHPENLGPRLPNFDDANLRRSAIAAASSVRRIERALQILKGDAPQHLLYAGQLRLNNTHASLEELGKLAEPAMTKDAIAGRIRRLLCLADKRAKTLGIPDTFS